MTTARDFRLGEVLVEPARLRLRSPAGEIEVQPRVMDVIEALAADDGTVVSRQVLLGRVWGTTQVGYHALARAIYEARKAFAGVAPDQTFIETIPQRGYRMCVRRTAPVPAPLAGAKSWNPLSDSTQGRVSLALASLLGLGLFMHAIDRHGSAIHLAGAAGILIAVFGHPTSWRRRIGAG